MTKKIFEVLDCTLRDGGYYNNWDFSLDLVGDYLKSISSSGIKYIELGFRSFPSKSFRGSNWYTTENYINSLSISKNLKIAVMLNAAEVINNESLEKNIKKLFVKNKSKIFLVRIAFHFDELDKTIQIANILKKLGYKVALNLMQISEITEENLAKVSKKINNSKADIFYFADSLGSLNPSKVKKIITTIKKRLEKKI